MRARRAREGAVWAIVAVDPEKRPKSRTDALPAVGRAILDIYGAWRRDRPLDEPGGAGDDAADGPSPMAIPSEEVTDFMQRRLNYFAPLEEAAEALLTAQLADPRVQLFGDDRGFVAVAPTTGPGWREVARWGDTERAARAAGEFLRGRGVGTLLHFGESDYGCDARPLQTLHASFLWRQRKEGEGDAE